MADTVIYEFTVRNAGVATPWETTPANMVNGVETDYAETNNDGETEELVENDCPGTDLGTISKVELRTYGYGDADDRIDITPYFGGVSAGDEHQITPGTIADWGIWQDITSDPNAPDWSLWSHIQDLDAYIEYDSVAGKGIMHCGMVQIQVTYSTGVPVIEGAAVLQTSGQSIGAASLMVMGSVSIQAGAQSSGLGLQNILAIAGLEGTGQALSVGLLDIKGTMIFNAVGQLTAIGERLLEVLVTLQTSGQLISTGILDIKSSSLFESSGSINAIALLTILDSVSFQTSSSLLGVALDIVEAVVSLLGAATFSAAGILVIDEEALFQATGILEGLGELLTDASVVIEAGGELSAAGFQELLAQANLEGSGQFLGTALLDIVASSIMQSSDAIDATAFLLVLCTALFQTSSTLAASGEVTSGAIEAIASLQAGSNFIGSGLLEINVATLLQATGILKILNSKTSIAFIGALTGLSAMSGHIWTE